MDVFHPVLPPLSGFYFYTSLLPYFVNKNVRVQIDRKELLRAFWAFLFQSAQDFVYILLQRENAGSRLKPICHACTGLFPYHFATV